MKRSIGTTKDYCDPKPDSSMLDTDGFGEGYKYSYPLFHRDVERCDNLDELVQASGFSKKHPGDRDLETAVQGMRDETYEDEQGHSESDGTEDEHDYYYTESEEESNDGTDNGEFDEEEENERIIDALSNGVGNLKMDKLGNYILED